MKTIIAALTLIFLALGCSENSTKSSSNASSTSSQSMAEPAAKSESIASANDGYSKQRLEEITLKEALEHASAEAVNKQTYTRSDNVIGDACMDFVASIYAANELANAGFTDASQLLAGKSIETYEEGPIKTYVALGFLGKNSYNMAKLKSVSIAAEVVALRNYAPLTDLVKNTMNVCNQHLKK